MKENINMTYILKINEIPDISKIAELYDDAGWSNYTKDLDVLLKAFYSSLCIITAWDNNELVGVLRAVGDGMTIVYIQDILVKKTYQRQGIGKLLINEVMNEYKNVRQKVLLTENESNTIQFYKSCGFHTAQSYNTVAFVNFN